MKITFLIPLFFFSLLTFSNKGSCDEMYFKEIPKAELHLHLGGAFPKEYLMSIANPSQRNTLDLALSKVKDGVDYTEVFSVFRVIAQLINSEQKLKKGVEELCLSLKRDQVHYVEIRTGLKDYGKGYEEYLKAVLDGMKEQASETFFPKLVLSLQRSSTPEMAEITVELAKKYQDHGVVGIDISGDSTKGEIDRIMPQLLQAKSAGLPFLVHMGEHPGESDQLYLLELLQPSRVGHAVHLSDEAKEWILQHQIPIEICLSSSVLVKMIDHYHQHPGINLFRIGHPVVFCTDDPLLFSTSMSQELQIAHDTCGLSVEEIEKIVESSFKHTLSQ